MKTRYYINEHDKLVIVDFDKLEQHLRNKKVQSGDCDFTPDSENISHQQRKYFYGLIAEMICNEFRDRGNDVDKIKDVIPFIKNQWMYYEKFCPITGMYIKVLYSLSNSSKALSREIFQEKKMLIQQWGLEKLGIDIPDPDPNWKVYK